MNLTRLSNLVIALVVLVVLGCQPKMKEVPLFTYDSQNVVALSAAAHARDIGGYVTNILPTGSMRPALEGGDLVVVSNPANDPFENIEKGDMVRYLAPNSPHFEVGIGPIMHRAVLFNGGGWVMSGDHNAHSESKWRLTKENYLGRAVAIYRLKTL